MGLGGEPGKVDPNKSGWGETIELSNLGEISAAFPRLPKDKIMEEIEKEGTIPVSQAPSDASSSTPATSQPGQPQDQSQSRSETITIDDFAKVDLRVATVLEAERVPKADRLLRLMVDVGEPQPRQILAGIALYYNPEDLIGRKIIVVSNLAPRKLRGLESNGMLLAASVGEEGRPVLATFTEDVPNGARLK
jgi:methionyl-tRNA synthetase